MGLTILSVVAQPVRVHDHSLHKNMDNNGSNRFDPEESKITH
jgi:hypothetical protein